MKKLYELMERIEDKKGYRGLQTVIEDANITYRVTVTSTFTDHFHRHLQTYLENIETTEEKIKRRRHKSDDDLFSNTDN